jgi:hypothetical protein
MALWYRLLNTAIGVADLALMRASKRPAAEATALSGRSGPPQVLERRLAGVVVSALKEVFVRDTRRQEFEREQAEAQRRRAERALRIDLVRQAGERELGRARLVAGVGVAGWVSSLILSWRWMGGGPGGGRLVLGLGWAAMVAGLAAAFIGYSTVARTLGEVDQLSDLTPDRLTSAACAAGAWLILTGFILVGLAVLLA